MYKNSVKRVFGKNAEVSNDSYATHLNNNDLIIGPSGAGKTTGYVIPNLMNKYGSYIVADTKGNLYNKYGASFEKAGYHVKLLDFSNLRNSCVYNPFDYIEKYSDHEYYEQDVISLASIICPIKTANDPFWEKSAQEVIVSLIAYTIEALPVSEHNLVTVVQLFKMLGKDASKKMFESWSVEKPDSFAVKKYKMYASVMSADKTWGCICQFVTNALSLFDFKESMRAFGHRSEFDFRDLGRQESVLFVNISDVDRSMDRIVNIFYAQAFQVLCRFADSNPDSRLEVPVRIILDDFATNTYIPDFDKTMSVIRSREISASIILQSLTQLESLYAKNQATTIINNCDHILYLGGQDIPTAEYIAYRVSKSPENVLNQELDKAYLLTRGSKAQLIEKILPESLSDAEEEIEDVDFDYDVLDEEEDLPF